MDTVGRITLEVHRILSSPYEVSLKKLHDILIHAKQQTLHSWSCSNPCQINGLATAVLDALEHWPFSLDILRILSCIPSFRDEVLQQRPMLLHTLLTDATTSEQGFGKYATTCTSLLSTTLQIPEPANLPIFLSRLLEKAIQFPSVNNIRPLYMVLSGVTPKFLDVLPIDSVTRLQDQLIRLLRGLAVEDHSSNLICLAILAKLSASDLSVAKILPIRDNSSLLQITSSNDEPMLTTPERYKSAQQFFKTGRASKMLDLVVLKVILACSRSCDLCPSEIVESLKLSEEIVNAICVEEKKSWMLKNSAKGRKLFEKILRSDIEQEVQHAAINFTISLLEGQSFPLEFTRSFKSLLFISIPFTLAPRTVERYLSECDESTICSQLMELLDLSCSEPARSIESLAKLNNAINVISGLSTGVKTSARLRQAILFSLSTNELSQSLHRFLSTNSLMCPTDISHDGSGPCPCSSSQKIFDLRRGMCDLILKTALCASQDEISLDSLVSLALLDAMKNPSRAVTIKCGYYSSKPVPLSVNPVSYLQSGGSHSVNLANRCWKEKLLNRMTMSMKAQHESVISMMRDITQDLEDRCDTAELPFRKEQERSSEVNQKLKSAESKLAELNFQMEKSNSVLKEIGLEKAKMLEQAEIAEKRFQDSLATHKDLQIKIDRIEKEAFEAASVADQMAKQNDLAHMAILTGKDELYEEQTLKVINLEARITSLTEELLEMRSRGSATEERINCLVESLAKKDEEFEKAKQSEASKQTEIERFTELEAKAIVEKQELIMKLTEFDRQCKQLGSEMIANNSAHESELASFRLEHETQLAAKGSELLHRSSLYESAIGELKRELEKVNESISSTVMQTKKILAGSERKINKLLREREEREREFAEVQDLSSKLMAVMGMKQNRNPVETRAKNVQNGHLPDADFGGPTPKRSKTHRSFKSSLAHKMEIYPGSVIDTGNRGGQRFPLKDLEFTRQNVEVSTPTQRLPLTRAQISSAHTEVLGIERENADFKMGEACGSLDDSDIFTSTGQHQSGSVHERVRTEIYDDTTVDF